MMQLCARISSRHRAAYLSFVCSNRASSSVWYPLGLAYIAILSKKKMRCDYMTIDIPSWLFDIIAIALKGRLATKSIIYLFTISAQSWRIALQLTGWDRNMAETLLGDKSYFFSAKYSVTSPSIAYGGHSRASALIQHLLASAFSGRYFIGRHDFWCEKGVS